MQLIVQHFVFAQGPNKKKGGRIKVTVGFGHLIKKTREFVYGDERYDPYTTQEEAKQAVKEFCDGVQLTFSVFTDQLKSSSNQLILDTKSYDDFFKKK